MPGQSTRTFAHWYYVPATPWWVTLGDVLTVLVAMVLVNAGVDPFDSWKAVTRTFFPVFHIALVVREFSLQVERGFAHPKLRDNRPHWQWISSELDAYTALVLISTAADVTAIFSALLHETQNVYLAIVAPLCAFNVLRMVCILERTPSTDHVYPRLVHSALVRQTGATPQRMVM
jgi:uncharacterized membrane protein YkvI